MLDSTGAGRLARHPLIFGIPDSALEPAVTECPVGNESDGGKLVASPFRCDTISA